MDQIAVMKQALEALKLALKIMEEDWHRIDNEFGPSAGGLAAAISGELTGHEYFGTTIKAITTLRQAIEQAERHEPEQLATLGWQEIDCPICGGGARAFPEQAQPVAWLHLKRLLDSMRDESNAKANLDEWLRASPALVVKAAQAEDEWIKAAKNLVAVQMAAQEYVASNTAAPPQRKPMTDEQIDKVTDAQWASNNHFPVYAAHRAYARAIEAAHGIKGDA